VDQAVEQLSRAAVHQRLGVAVRAPGKEGEAEVVLSIECLRLARDNRLTFIR
jgi:hypothetical protein